MPTGANAISRVTAPFSKKVAPKKSFTGYRHRIATLLRNAEFKASSKMRYGTYYTRSEMREIAEYLA
jgi:hypothetical protein